MLVVCGTDAVIRQLGGRLGVAWQAAAHLGQHAWLSAQAQAGNWRLWPADLRRTSLAAARRERVISRSKEEPQGRGELAGAGRNHTDAMVVCAWFYLTKKNTPADTGTAQKASMQHPQPAA